ncbi:hypothetical protein QUB05_25740, partial [Microcoleus sp. F10-C6]|uniref:hypothetical protein n=1 Tax=unclassified Microcoleus TaxID=2642155 RepID=UPI002FCFB1D2
VLSCSAGRKILAHIILLTIYKTGMLPVQSPVVSEETLKIYGQTETDLQCCISHPLQTGLFKASVVFLDACYTNAKL